MRGTPGVSLNSFSRPSPAAAPAWSTLPAVMAAAPTASAGQRPMAAANDRTLDAPASGVAMDMEAMRQTLMRDLMSQIRADMERGG